MQGEKNHNVVELPIVKLKTIFTYVEQLFTGSVYSILAVKNLKHPPRSIKDMLKQLSTMPQWVIETRKATAHVGANMALARAKVYLPELDVELLKGGFSEFKLDGSAFTHEDYARCLLEIRPLASLIADEVDISRYHPAYTTDNERVNAAKNEPSNLLSTRCKTTFAPDIDASALVEGTANFESLLSIRWQQKGQQVEDDDETAGSGPEAADDTA